MAGGVDWIFNVPPDQANQLKTVPTLEVKAGETMRIVFLHFNSTDKTPIPALKAIN